MDKWEFFQDAEGLWRWRRTSADGRRVLNSLRSHPTRKLAVTDAASHGYIEGATEVDLDATSVNLQVLRADD